MLGGGTLLPRTCIPSPSLASLWSGKEGVRARMDGKLELRAQGRSPPGAASEAASRSASRGTPVLSVSLLIRQMNPHSQEPVLGK